MTTCLRAMKTCRSNMKTSLLAAAAALVFSLSSCAQSPQSLSPGAWMEIPQVPEARAADVYALGMQVGGKSQRNYTFLWDSSHLTADWVAYPLCRGNIGEGKRSNAFGLNPFLPESEQPLLVKGYREGNAGWYSRGHQIPSADRLAYKANVQTFYGTNMTPQDEDLNGGVWGTLENKVRSWAMKCDTLYVVSGCTYEGYSGDYVKDNGGKKVAVPTGYYKALLMLSNGEYHACAFRFENRPYPDGKYHPEMAETLSSLEQKTGITFFPRLKDIVGEVQYRAIKSENPAQTGLWR